MSVMTSLVPAVWGWKRAAVGLVALGLCCASAAGCGAAHKRAGALPAGTASGTTTVPPGSTTTSSTVAGTGPNGATGSPASRGSSTTLAGHAPVASSGSSPLAGGNGAPAPAAPGTYTVDQSGSVTGPGFSSNEPPQGTFVVDPAQANGVQAWHRYVDTSKPPANTQAQFTANGPFILSTTEQSPQGNTTCTFNPPIAAPPWPPAAGKTFSSQGSCGSFNVALQGRITGSQTMTLKDGETFTVWVIDSTLNLSGQVTGSGTQVDWYSPALRLSLHEQIDISGAFGAFNFNLHSVSDFVSSHPT